MIRTFAGQSQQGLEKPEDQAASLQQDVGLQFHARLQRRRAAGEIHQLRIQRDRDSI